MPTCLSGGNMNAPNSHVSLEFLGGAGTVTGSKILLTVREHKVLVDCGLFQGLKKLRLMNWETLPIDVNELETVFLTHAHLDHSGYIPALVRNGYKGAVHCTPPTRDITEIILKDSGKLQEEDAEHANKYGYTHHMPAKPLYSVSDAEEAMKHFVTHELETWHELNKDIRFRFRNSGHIPGSVFIEFEVDDEHIVFTGDLGRQHPILLSKPEPVEHADYLIMESTYGDRLHPESDPYDDLADVINRTYRKGGSLIIPSFAVERAQEVLFLISKLRRNGRIPRKIPIYLDSPMAVNVTEVMTRYVDWLSITHKECEEACGEVEMVTSVEESRSLVEDRRQKIVIAGSGMVTGGRVLHYLEKAIDNKANTILLTGYQAEGTRGRQLRDGVHEIKFFGKYHKVNADVREITCFSAHADQAEMLAWLSKIQNKPKKVFINHGEQQPAHVFALKISDTFGWDCEIAQMDKVYPLEIGLAVP